MAFPQVFMRELSLSLAAVGQRRESSQIEWPGHGQKTNSNIPYCFFFLSTFNWLQGFLKLSKPKD